jgi:hypothetical protein
VIRYERNLLLLGFVWAFCHLRSLTLLTVKPGVDNVRANVEIICGCLLLLILQRKYNVLVRGLFVGNPGLILPFASFDYMHSNVIYEYVGVTTAALLCCINFVFVFLIGHPVCKHLHTACHVSLPNFPQ